MKNYGLTIHLGENYNIDLKHILKVIGHTGKLSNWKISNAECFGENSYKIHEISDTKEQITGEEFYKLVLGINQTISGEFNAFKLNKNYSWLTIRSIRGKEFDIETEDKELLNRICKSFHNISDLIY